MYPASAPASYPISYRNDEFAWEEEEIVAGENQRVTTRIKQ
jgi:hypothetical protein